MPVFSRQHRMPVPASELFAWHERPGAFERLNPPWDPVRVVARSGGIRDGDRATVRVSFAGPIGLDWTLEHRDYIAGRQFRDVQVQGPFARWEHTHAMAPAGDNGHDASVLTDTIAFEAPLRWAGGVVVEPLITGMLDRLFAYRHALTAGDLARHAQVGGPPLRIAITGATGFVGAALDAFLSTGGHAVHRLVRGRPDPARPHADIPWDPARGTIAAEALEGVDAVIHLAGASVAERWTPAHRRAILDSRAQGTALLARTLAGLRAKPRVLVSASAVGWYGD
nr:NAD-dependent epimerase/dehydratase family protein [Gemmatimonadaceae bacterium]